MSKRLLETLAGLRPERSLDELAAVLADVARAVTGSPVAVVRVHPPGAPDAVATGVASSPDGPPVATVLGDPPGPDVGVITLATGDGQSIGELRLLPLWDDDATAAEAAGLAAHLATLAAATVEDHLRYRAARRQERHFRALFDRSPLAIIDLDADNRVQHWNPAAEALFGWTAEEVLGRPLPTVPPDRTEEFDEIHARVLAGETITVETERLTKAGERLEVELTLVPMSDERGRIVGTMGVVTDVSERNRAERQRVEVEAQLAHQALHDPLTGLPNRTLLLDRMRQALARSGRRPGPAAVLFVDLDRFKLVNDSLGHDVGDELLVAVAERLQAEVRPHDTVARLAGDEFVLLCEEISRPEEASGLAERITAALARPFRLGEREVYIATSVGVALATGDPEESPEALLRDADVAMYRAKELGRGRYEVFDQQLRERTIERQRLENDLRRAVDRGELRLHYQPIIDLRSRRLAGVEALLRWEHTTRGLVTPGRFLDLAEDTGLIVPLGSWVLDAACNQAAFWSRLRAGDGEAPLLVGVNTSVRQLTTPGFADQVAAVLERAGLPAAQLCLELNGPLEVGDDERVERALEQLAGAGVQLALDRFGTGGAALAEMRRLPRLRSVKVGQGEVGSLGRFPDDAGVLGATVDLAHALGVRVTAVGVETSQQAGVLADLGCDEAQGQLFCRPLPAVAIDHLLRQRRTW